MDNSVRLSEINLGEKGEDPETKGNSKTFRSYPTASTYLPTNVWSDKAGRTYARRSSRNKCADEGAPEVSLPASNSVGRMPLPLYIARRNARLA